MALLACLLALPSAVRAQEATLQNGGMDLHLFRPAIDTRGYFSVNGSEVMPHKEFSFGLVLDAGFGILRYNGFINDPNQAADEASTQNRISRQAFTGTFIFNFALFDRLLLGISLPITFFRGNAVQTPDQTSLGGTCVGTTATGCLYNYEAAGLRSQGVGDLTIHLKGRLLNLGEYPLGIAVTLRAGFPTAKDDQFAGEPGFSLWPTLVLEFQPIEKIRLGLEGGYRWNSRQGATFIWDGRSIPSTDPAVNPSNVAIAPVDQGEGRRFTYDDLITFGFGAAFRIASPLDLILELYGTQIAQEIGTKGTLSMEALLGFKYFVTGKSFLYVAGGAGIPTTGFQAADARAVLGFMYEPTVGDRDGDGIADDDDGCPDEPEDKDGFEDADGCPDLDNDGDGIPDYLDKSPNAAEDMDGYEDADGIPDYDNDNDGILDADDKSPNAPEDIDGYLDEDGTPDPDNDQDGILDVDDECPDEPETMNGYEDTDGCPDEAMQFMIPEEQSQVMEGVNFATGSADLTPTAKDILSNVLRMLRNETDIRVEVQGYTDNVGSQNANLRLSQRRADMVKDYLVSGGVSASRIIAKGYGENNPIATNETIEGRGMNRRIEFKRLD